MGDAKDAKAKSEYLVLRQLGARVESTHAAARGSHDLVVVQRFSTKAIGGAKRDVIQREASALAKNWHPNVARVRYVEVVDNDELFIATELIDGMTLFDLFAAAATKRTSDKSPMLEPAVLLRIVLDVLAGLQNIHGLRDELTAGNAPLGAFHGAVCPRNIVVGKDGVARLIATFRPRPILIRGGAEALCYSAPEALEEQGAGSASSDLYACGVILWEGLQGRPLRSEKQPAQVLHRQREEDIPWDAPPASIVARLGVVVLRALGFEPALRFRTPGELALAIRRSAGSEIASGSTLAQLVVSLAGDRLRARRADLEGRIPGRTGGSNAKLSAAVLPPTTTTPAITPAPVAPVAPVALVAKTTAVAPASDEPLPPTIRGGDVPKSDPQLVAASLSTPKSDPKLVAAARAHPAAASTRIGPKSDPALKVAAKAAPPPSDPALEHAIVHAHAADNSRRDDDDDDDDDEIPMSDPVLNTAPIAPITTIVATPPKPLKPLRPPVVVVTPSSPELTNSPANAQEAQSDPLLLINVKTAKAGSAALFAPTSTSPALPPPVPQRAPIPLMAPAVAARPRASPPPTPKHTPIVVTPVPVAVAVAVAAAAAAAAPTAPPTMRQQQAPRTPAEEVAVETHATSPMAAVFRRGVPIRTAFAIVVVAVVVTLLIILLVVKSRDTVATTTTTTPTTTTTTMTAGGNREPTPATTVDNATIDASWNVGEQQDPNAEAGSPNAFGVGANGGGGGGLNDAGDQAPELPTASPAPTTSGPPKKTPYEPLGI